MRSRKFSALYSVAALPVAAMAVLAIGSPGALAGTPRVNATTPPGLTLVEVVREGGDNSQPVILWVRPGDADGRTLLVFDADRAGVSNCAAECSQEFPPLLAQPQARAFGDWSLVRRSDGARQWAYQSQPLYTWVKEKVPGEVATNVGESELPNYPSLKVLLRLYGMADDSGMPLTPPKGWKVARFMPAAALALPDGIQARQVPSAQGVVLVDVRGLTLYAFEGDARRDGQACTASGCNLRWIPLAAPALGSGIGDFSVVARVDGSKQWAYRKRPLYVYQADKLPGDVHGIGVDRKWTVAEITADFNPPKVGVTTLNGYGDVLSLDGMTLYGGYPFEKRWGGRNLRDTFLHNAYFKGKKLGGAACVDQGCLSSWHPFLAPADAQPQGFWEPISRADGGKQWAYKGYALYTYAGDKAPGDHSGQAIYDFEKVEGSASELQHAFMVVNISKAPGGAGIYWSVARP